MTASDTTSGTSGSSASWLIAQAEYWNSVAVCYDQLYMGSWSNSEDVAVVNRLRRYALAPQSVLDLGCGTGLGHDLAVAAFGEVSYHGRDISIAMLETLQARRAGLVTSLGPMEDLHDLPDKSFDLVSAFSTAASYAADTMALLREARRVLKPSGLLYVSALSRTSLRRLVRGRVRPTEVYRTRNEHNSEHGVPARTFTRRQLGSYLRRSGFEVLCIDTQGTLSGVWERTTLWRLSRLADACLPLGHTLEAIARREDCR